MQPQHARQPPCLCGHSWYSYPIVNPTRLSYGTEPCIDLTLSSLRLEPTTQWNVASSPNDSDHCLMGNRPEEHVAERYNIKAAIWDLYRTNNSWDNIPVDIRNIECENLLDDLYNRYDEAASASIPNVTIRKFFPKPYWTAQLTQSHSNREFFYEKYRHSKSARNIMLLKKSRAEHWKLLRDTKRKHWIQLANSFTVRTPKSKIYENIRKIQRRNGCKVNILRDGNTTFSTVPEIANQLAGTFSNVSSPDNYHHNFLTMKNAIETVPLNFISNNIDNYNKIFTINELDTALNRTRNTSQ